MSRTSVAIVVLLAAVVQARAESLPADDDLAVVKKAVAAIPAPQSERVAPPAERAAPPAVERDASASTTTTKPQRTAVTTARVSGRVARQAARTGAAPQWLRIRVSERDGEKVAVNVPISFARALAKSSPRSCVGSHGADCTTFQDVLRTLRSGEDLVTISDGGDTVRVWVD